MSTARLGPCSVRLTEYTPELFETLAGMAKRLDHHASLAHRPFVDYYYARSDWCRLFMILAEEGNAIATLGLEKMPFEYDSQKITVGCGSNFHSLRPGAGIYLFLHSLKLTSISLVYEGSEETHRIIRKQNWNFFSGVRKYVLNKPYSPYPGEAKWRVAAKWVLRNTKRKRIPEYASGIPTNIAAKLSVREERDYTQDLMIPRSPFRLRFAPSPEYLNWRYNTRLSFVRYRLFRILDKEKPVGYVILNDSPEGILVAQCDGEDTDTLAYGVLLSILEAGNGDTKPRGVYLISSHARMQKIYEQFGFEKDGPDRPFALGPGRSNFELDADTSDWHVNLDWGDNGLLGPFLDELPGSG
jgi:hypothetical protein